MLLLNLFLHLEPHAYVASLRHQQPFLNVQFVIKKRQLSRKLDKNRV